MSERRFLTRVFLVALALRIVSLVAVNALDLIDRVNFARDSRKYHEIGAFLSRQLDAGANLTYGWVDHGWFMLTGHVYAWLGISAIPIQLLNVLLGALLPIATYRLTRLVSGEAAPARLAAWLTALLPSLIFWSSVPLKDMASILAMTLLVYGLCELRIRFRWRTVLLLGVVLLVQLSLRQYLFLVAMILIPLSQVPISYRGHQRKLFTVLSVTFAFGALAFVLGYGFLATEEIMRSAYFDVDFINDARRDIAEGSGAIFSDAEAAQWGQSGVSDLTRIFLAAYYFVVSLDFREIGSIRQLIALPEVLVVLSLLPLAWVGGRMMWRYRREVVLPLFIYGFAIAVVYGAATTNMGAMYRWRAQVIPLFICLASIGIYYRPAGIWSLVFRGTLRERKAPSTGTLTRKPVSNHS